MTDPVVNGPIVNREPEVVPEKTLRSDSSESLRPADRASEQSSSIVAAKPDDVGAEDRSRSSGDDADGGEFDAAGDTARRRRGSRGGRNRSRAPGDFSDEGDGEIDGDRDDKSDPVSKAARSTSAGDGDESPSGTPSGRGPRAGSAASDAGAKRRSPGAGAKQPDQQSGGGRTRSKTPKETADGLGDDPNAASSGSTRAPRIGDTRPAPASAEAAQTSGDAKKPAGGPTRSDSETSNEQPSSGNRRRRGGRGRGGSGGGQGRENARENGPARPTVQPIEASLPDEPLEMSARDMKRRGGRERKGRPVGRYLMCVSVSPKATQISVLEGRNLIEHYVSRPADDVAQIHGNIYLGKVQNVLPGMEAAFIDIGTPKNAVLYRGDITHDPDDVEEKGQARIEQILKPKQTILCQVTKNPIAHKGARLTQEVSLPGRFVVLIPNTTTYGISKRLPDNERKRLRNILDKVRPKGHGLIVRTAAEGVTAEEIERDILQLGKQWEQISALAESAGSPALLYREPDMAVRVIREEFNQEYRGIVIDDKVLFDEVRSYVNAISPALADRVQFYDRTIEPLSMYERHHIHEQLHRALDRKVWLPSGGSLIIEHTEALTVIDVNTGKNVGSSNLEETVFRNNLEAAEEIAKQLRLRDIGGIIVIDFIDMEIEKNRREVIKGFRDALARDKTRTQAFDITSLGLVEMTRKRIGEGLLESFSVRCPECDGRGFNLDEDLIV